MNRLEELLEGAPASGLERLHGGPCGDGGGASVPQTVDHDDPEPSAHPLDRPPVSGHRLSGERHADGSHRDADAKGLGGPGTREDPGGEDASLPRGGPDVEPVRVPLHRPEADAPRAARREPVAEAGADLEAGPGIDGEELHPDAPVREAPEEHLSVATGVLHEIRAQLGRDQRHAAAVVLVETDRLGERGRLTAHLSRVGGMGDGDDERLHRAVYFHRATTTRVP
jgi:hypothetical protein